MSHQLKPGDLAIIVGVSDPAASSMVGKCVELLQRLTNQERAEIGGVFWRGCDIPAWVVQGDGLVMKRRVTGLYQNQTLTMISESRLMPLRGDFAPEQAKSHEVPA